MNVSKLAIAALIGLTLATPTFAMNKAELIEAVASESGLSKADAERAVKGFINTTAKALKKGDKVSLVGFGSFSISNRAARTGRNPQTGKEIQISKVRFDVDRPLAEAAYPIYVQNYWTEVNSLNARNLRGLVNVNAKDSKDEKSNMSPDSFFDIMTNFGRTFGQMLTKEDPNQMLKEESRKEYAEVLGKFLSETSRGGELLAHEAAHVIQQRAGQNMKSAVEALAVKAIKMEKHYITGGGNVNGNITIEGMRRGGGNVNGNITIHNGLRLDNSDEAVGVRSTIVKIMNNALSKGDCIDLEEFGAFTPGKGSAKSVGRDPQTGKEIKIAAKNVVRFKAGADLSRKIN